MPRPALEQRIQQMSRLFTADYIIGLHMRTKGPKDWKEVRLWCFW